MGFRWHFLLKFMVHVWTHRFPRWLKIWARKSSEPERVPQTGSVTSRKASSGAESHQLANFIFLIFLMEKNEVRLKRSGCCLSNKGTPDCAHALIFSTGGIQSLSSFPISFWDLYSALNSACSIGISFCLLFFFSSVSVAQGDEAPGCWEGACCLPFSCRPHSEIQEGWLQLLKLAISCELLRFLRYLQWDEEMWLCLLSCRAL